MSITGRSIIEFGKGDVSVMSGNIKDLGILSLKTLEEPKEIGFNLGTKNLNGEELLDETEVLMTFKNVESIDVSIFIASTVRRRLFFSIWSPALT